MSAVTPSKIFNSSVVALNDANLLISLAVAVTAVPLRVRLVAAIRPETVTRSLANVIRSESPVYPIEEPLIVILSKNNKLKPQKILSEVFQNELLLLLIQTIFSFFQRWRLIQSIK